jgi:hypothetical protein
MTKLKISEIKEHLKSLSKEEIAVEVIELFKKYPIIQEHYYSILKPNNEELLIKYKKLIEKEFNPLGKEILRYPIIKKTIKDFKNISNNPEQVADLMLYTVECGTDFTNSFGDINQKFYHTIAEIYEQALEFIFECHLENVFIDRCRNIMKNSEDIGWGFGFDIAETYNNFFGYVEEE